MELNYHQRFGIVLMFVAVPFIPNKGVDITIMLAIVYAVGGIFFMYGK